MSMRSLMSGTASESLKKTIPALGPRTDLCFVVVTTSQRSKGDGVLLRGNEARDVSDARWRGTSQNRWCEGRPRHHRESWQGGRSTPVSTTSRIR